MFRHIISFLKRYTKQTSREFKIRLYGVKSITQSFLKLPPLLYKCGGKAKRCLARFLVNSEEWIVKSCGSFYFLIHQFASWGSLTVWQFGSFWDMPAALKHFLCLRRLNTKKTETRRHGDGVDKNVPPRNLICKKWQARCWNEEWRTCIKSHAKFAKFAKFL
jgi:hypothetical protein